MWPFKRNKWKPPNSPLTQEDFASRGGYEFFQGFLDLRDRVGKIEGAMILLVPLVLAILGLLIAEGVR